MISLFNLIKKANSEEHNITYDIFQGFEDFSQEEPAVNNEPSVDEYQIEDLMFSKKKLLQEIEELEAKSKKILVDAANEADQIREDARTKGFEMGQERGYSEGTDLGYEDALKEGLRQVKAENKEMLDALKAILESTEEKKQEILRKYQEDLKDIAISVAEKVVHVSLKSSGDVIKRMILSATEGIKNREWAKIYIAKTDSQLLVEGDTNLLKEISYISDHIKVIVMDEEAPGTCIIELPDKVLDASANTQIENIRDILNSARV